MEKKTRNRDMSALEQYPDYVRAIGMISIENANLEMQMARLFSRILFIPLRVGIAIYLTPKSATARVEIFKAAIKATLRPRGNEEHKKKLKEALQHSSRLADRVITAVGKRHQIIHDGWGVDPDTGDVVRYPSNKAASEQPVALEELNRLITETRSLITDIKSAAEEYRKSPPTLVSLRDSPPEKTPPQTQDHQQPP
jgi:hypothetical protein